MWRKRITVTLESSSDRNLMFHDNYTWNDMTRAQFVKQIENWNYSNYHVRLINDIKTPVSNPDSKVDNNLW